MKSAIQISLTVGLTTITALASIPVLAQNQSNWTYIGTTVENESHYVDTGNLVRNGSSVLFYQRVMRPASYYSVSRFLADCDDNLFTILSVSDYFPSGRISGSSSVASLPFDVLPGTVGWSTLQTVCSELTESFEAMGEGFLLGSPGSRINIRNRPGIDAPISRVGSPGDEVVIWDSTSVDGRIWYKVALRDSNATGWVREDLIQIYE
jgi:Bacterial SH3 domain